MCALGLAARGYPVILVTGSPRRLSYCETCSSLAASLFEAACRHPIPQTVCSPLNTFASAWGSSTLQIRQLHAEPTGSHYLLTRPALDDWLLTAAIAAGITVIPDCTLERGNARGTEWQLKSRTTSQCRSVAASFVVEATGRAGRAATRPEVYRHYLDALVCATFEVRPPVQLTSTLPDAMVESCPQGWWYMVRHPKGGLTLSCFSDADLLPAATAQRDWLITQLRSTIHLACLAGYFPADTPIRVCEARTSVRHTLWEDNWICIGDAAWSLDPLSGTGIEQAIRSGIGAAAALAAYMESPGQTDHIRQYAQARGQSFRQMLISRRWYYHLEMRWPESQFWRRRQ
jgi:2-polyprenyl-6-methoxyphenol hydroxylase-like FAD-dependent oxidoreductase